ncbi:hypothetical protein G7Z17_g4851 [Cylindrodendrum hubeiense]|uniref:Uncharacterized protein n=1 Tax=Cylindrodendrum hubeiense TaxID=595255 RepID=A0A9P5H821_9HYPO|nr:hypothetical protein G7Z17_g4851 [Cylindrodendrum hubeiense]
MKFLSILSASALVAGAVAGPIAAPVAGAVAKREDGTDTWYRLKVKSYAKAPRSSNGLNHTDALDLQCRNLRTQLTRPCSDFKSLEDKYLGVKSSVVGVYDDALEGNGVQITLGSGENSEVSMPAYPVGIVEHALGLVGTNGYLEFQDLTKPSNHTADEET